MSLATGSPRRLLAVLLAPLVLAAAALGMPVSPATGAPITPERIVVQAVTGYAAPEGIPTDAAPAALIEAGEPFTVTVRFETLSGQAASFSKDTVLTISTDTAGDNQPSTSTGVAEKGQSTAILPTALPHAANQVTLTVAVKQNGGKTRVLPGRSVAFDVLKDLRYETAAVDTSLTAGIGGLDDCSAATADDPVCGVVMLPRGAAGGQVLLSTGLCGAPGDAYGCGDPRGSVVQVLADLDRVESGAVENLYTPTSPAVLLVRCDKSLCGGGAIHDVRLKYTLSGTGTIGVPAPDCPAKGAMADDQTPCVDYVQSTRDGVGDTLLYFLFVRDARISVS